MFKLNYTLISCLLTTFLLAHSFSAQVEVKEYYENGDIQIMGNLNGNNLKIGKREHFYENGDIRYIVNYENDLFMGIHKNTMKIGN